MKSIWKRALLSAFTLGVGMFSYTYLRGVMPHQLDANTAPTASLKGTQQSNEALRSQLSQTSQQIGTLKADVKDAEVQDKVATTSMKNIQQEVLRLQSQLKAKRAKAAALALERKTQSQKHSVVEHASAPVVQTVTRASGGSDDGGDGSDKGSRNDD